MIARSHNTGQGLLEAIIAIGIILTATVASLTLIVSSIEAGHGVRERLIAMNLAREGMEVVHMTRDSNWLADREWTTGWALPGGTTKEIPVFTLTSIAPWWSIKKEIDINADDAKLYLESGRYVQQVGGIPSGHDSGFRRFITVAAVANSTSAYLVTVQVTYLVRNQTKTLSLQEHFTNWKP